SYSARMPRLRTAESLVLSDAAPAGSEPVRVSVSVDPAFCVTSAPPARLVTTSRSPVVSLAEISLAPGDSPAIVLSPKVSGCAAPVIPPKEVNRFDPHMSHQPRHDGTCVMAPDGCHHLHGAGA